MGMTIEKIDHGDELLINNDILADYIRSLARLCLANNTDGVKISIPMKKGNELIAHIKFDVRMAEVLEDGNDD